MRKEHWIHRLLRKMPCQQKGSPLVPGKFDAQRSEMLEGGAGEGGWLGEHSHTGKRGGRADVRWGWGCQRGNQEVR